MKKILYIIVFGLVSGLTTAQDGLFALTYNMGLPLGETADYIGKYSFRGFGMEGRGFVSDNISLGGSFSWNVFFEERLNETFTQGTESLTSDQFRYINAYPINFMAHYYFGTYESEVRFHAGLGVGAHKINRRTEFGTYALEHNYWHFGMTPDVGVLVPMNYRSNLLISVRYNYAFEAKSVAYSYLGFNIGFAWY
jgi:hypothetical protein